MKVLYVALISLVLWGACSPQNKGYALSGGDEGGAETPRALPEVIIGIDTASALQWADSFIEGMSLREKAAQLVMPALYTRSDSASIARLKDYAARLKVGGILLLKGDALSAAIIADSLEAVRDRNPLSPGFIISMDAENGLGMRFSDAPKFPWNDSITRSAEIGDFFDYGREIGREARIAGVNMILGPVVDVARLEDEAGSVMKFRSLGSDQVRVAEMAVAYCKGVGSQNVGSVVKHFPGHGATATDSHDSMPSVTLSRDEILGVDIHPFRSAVRAGVPAVMVGHLWVPALDSVARPASFSPVVIQGLLRDSMGFDGLVIVDAVNMGGAKGYSGVDAIIAGADILLAPVNTKREIERIVSAVASGRISEQRLNESLRRILIYKYSVNAGRGHRSAIAPADTTIKERLYQEALPIIDRLKGR